MDTEKRTKNIVTAEGPLVKNSEGVLFDEKFTPVQGKKYVLGRVDTGYTQKTQDGPKFVSNIIRFEAWGEAAEQLLLLKEQDWVSLTGYLKVSAYIDKKTQQPRVSQKVIAKTIQKV